MVDFKCQFLTFIPSSRSSENFGEVGKVVIISFMDKTNALKFNKKKLISEKYTDSYKDRHLVSIR